MSGMEDRERLSEDAHFELAMAAMAHERRNRPRGVLLFAGAVLLIAALFMAYGLNTRSNARSDLQSALETQSQVELQVAQWAHLEAVERDAGASRIGRRIDDLLTRMERKATQAGLSRPRPPREHPETQPGGIILRKYFYGEEPDPITAPTMAPLLEWLRLATSDEELGMEIEALNLKPDANNWRMTVTFRRLERPN